MSSRRSTRRGSSASSSSSSLSPSARREPCSNSYNRSPTAPTHDHIGIGASPSKHLAVSCDVIESRPHRDRRRRRTGTAGCNDASRLAKASGPSSAASWSLLNGTRLDRDFSIVSARRVESSSRRVESSSEQQRASTQQPPEHRHDACRYQCAIYINDYIVTVVSSYTKAVCVRVYVWPG